MAQKTGTRVKVVLRWIQILDTLDPAFQDKGEFRFMANVASDTAGARETRFPEQGHYSISDHPAWSRIGFEKVLFDGEVGDRLVVELTGEEIDTGSENDPLGRYSRTFEGNPEGWFGRYAPGNEGADDPESMEYWRICYDIEPG